MSSSTTTLSAHTIDITSVLNNAKELDRLRKEQEDAVVEINKIHKKCLSSTSEMVDKAAENMLFKLRGLYVQVRELSEHEVSVSNVLTAQLENLLHSGLSAAQRKKMEGNGQRTKRAKGDPDVSRHSPAYSLRIQLDAAASLKGEQVAARVTPDDADKDEWIVVKVINFDKEAKQFELLDEDPGEDEDGGGQRTYKLPMSRIIRFPKRNDPSTAPDFPTGKHVLAVYPLTTALYRATVVNPHRKRKADDYLLEFADDEEDDGSLPQRPVPFHKVVPLPEGHRQ